MMDSSIGQAAHDQAAAFRESVDVSQQHLVILHVLFWPSLHMRPHVSSGSMAVLYLHTAWMLLKAYLWSTRRQRD